MSILAELESGIVTGSAAETESVAMAFTEVFPENMTLALHGELGTGKTTFVRGLGRGWNVAEDITSPTYNIFSIYHSSNRVLVHLDAYRLSSAMEVEALMLEEFLIPPFCLAVEWPENLGQALPTEHWNIFLTIVDGCRHKLLLNRPEIIKQSNLD